MPCNTFQELPSHACGIRDGLTNIAGRLVQTCSALLWRTPSQILQAVSRTTSDLTQHMWGEAGAAPFVRTGSIDGRSYSIDVVSLAFVVGIFVITVVVDIAASFV